MANGEYSELLQRVTTLEAEQKHMDETVTKMASQVKEMHELLLQAKGAKWAIVGLAMLGGFLSAKLGAIATLFGFGIPGK